LTNWFGLKEWHDVVHVQCIICHSCITATRLSYLFYLWNFRRRLVRYYWCVYIYIIFYILICIWRFCLICKCCTYIELNRNRLNIDYIYIYTYIHIYI
jgi:hypothetical protein